MKSIDEAVAAFEAQYKASLPEEYAWSRELRDDGMDLLRAGEDVGLELLGEAVEVLGGLDWPETSDPEEVIQRERYASLYMFARGWARVGDMDIARLAAQSAVAHTPSVPEQFRDYLKADQYEIIAAGRLSLILSTANGLMLEDNAAHAIDQLARTTARRIRSIARYSEDPRQVLFSDRTMTPDQQKAARRRHRAIEAAASIGSWIPSRSARYHFARLCM